jgi:hypothetical protein
LPAVHSPCHSGSPHFSYNIVLHPAASLLPYK